MRFRDRPLLPSSIDREIYLARPELEEALLRPLKQGRNALLLGDAGSGKTTLMRRVAEELEGEEEEIVWVNGALAKTAGDLLAMVDAALDKEGSSNIPEEDGAGRLLELTRALAERPPVVIMVDGLSEAEVGFDLFGRLRDELWMAGHVWLVSATPKDSAALRSSPADAFWAAVVEIPPLDETEVSKLLQLGLTAGERLRLKRVPLAGYHPRLLIREVEGDLDQGSGKEQLARMRTLMERANGLGRSEGIALAELINLGRPASAHDPELLERLGWSRPYAQRIFSHLETAGLVRSIPEARGERTGRPRKLYEPNPLATE